MRAGAVAGVAAIADEIALFDPGAGRYDDRAKVPVAGLKALIVR